MDNANYSIEDKMILDEIANTDPNAPVAELPAMDMYDLELLEYINLLIDKHDQQAKDTIIIFNKERETMSNNINNDKAAAIAKLNIMNAKMASRFEDPNGKFTIEELKDPLLKAVAIRRMLDNGIVPQGCSDGAFRGDDPTLRNYFLAKPKAITPTPYKCLNKMLGGGLETSSVHVVTAETGIGKSTITGEIMYHFLKNGCAIANCILEDDYADTARRMVSIAISRNCRYEDIVDATPFDEHLATPRYYQYNDFGAVDRTIPFIVRIEILAATMKATHPDIPRWMLIDHISMLVTHSGAAERSELDSAMADIINIAKRHDIGIIVVSHLSRSNVQNALVINRLRGSGGIGQMAYTVISLSRKDNNPTATEEDRNTILMEVCKNRRGGITGMVDGELQYNHETGRLFEKLDFDPSDKPEVDSLQHVAESLGDPVEPPKNPVESSNESVKAISGYEKLLDYLK